MSTQKERRVPLYFTLLQYKGTVLLNDDRVDVNSKTDLGYTAFHFAVIDGHIATVQLFLNDVRVDVNSKTDLGSTPLHCAALEDHHEIVPLLLTSPRLNTANHVDDDGEAPIMKALLFQSTNAFRELVNHPSVDLSTTNKAGWSLEMVAR